MDDLAERAAIPASLKGLRACKRCALVKEAQHFSRFGCENCAFLDINGDDDRVVYYTSMHFDGIVSIMDPKNSWVAKWNYLSTFLPGVYALDVEGELPDEAKEKCESHGQRYRSQLKGKGRGPVHADEE